jgi:hypothetical protein
VSKSGINIDIFINCNWVFTWWQYTFTHKQYIEQHKSQLNNTNNKTNVEECRPCPFFASFTLALVLQRKNFSQVKKNLRIQYTYYQNIHILQNPHKHTHHNPPPHAHTHTHTHTHTLQNNIKPPQYKLKQIAYRKNNTMWRKNSISSM